MKSSLGKARQEWMDNPPWRSLFTRSQGDVQISKGHPAIHLEIEVYELERGAVRIKEQQSATEEISFVRDGIPRISQPGHILDILYIQKWELKALYSCLEC